MVKIYYYTTTRGNKPVKDFIESLSEKQRAKIFRIFQVIQDYGIYSVPKHVKKLEGAPLWEIRILDAYSIRIIYVVITGADILTLHGFIKKSQKTPSKEIKIALNRYRDWSERNIA